MLGRNNNVAIVPPTAAKKPVKPYYSLEAPVTALAWPTTPKA